LAQPPLGILIVCVFTAIAVAGGPRDYLRYGGAIFVEQKMVLLFETLKPAGGDVVADVHGRLVVFWSSGKAFPHLVIVSVQGTSESNRIAAPIRRQTGCPAQYDRQNARFLFCLPEFRNNFGNLIEYLDPAFHLTAVFRALHGLVSNEGQPGLAVAEILKEGHVIGTVDGLMFYA